MTTARADRFTPRTTARRRRLGQHFLRDRRAIARLVDVIAPQPGDRFLEIGPGRGALTAFLLERAARLAVIEIDSGLAATLRRRFSHHETFALIEGDILGTDLDEVARCLACKPDQPRFRVAGNLPYRIATAVIGKLLPHAEQIEDLTVMVQEEVAERLTAAPGQAAYGALTVFVRLHAEATAHFRLAARAFSPPPRVVSRVVSFRLAPVAQPERRARAVGLARTAFTHRRKQLPNSLKEAGYQTDRVEEALRAVGHPPTVRPQELRPQDYLELADLLPPPDPIS